MASVDTSRPAVTLQIDILERLPTPYGLVRYGVAPDHPEVKNVQHDFDQLFSSDKENDNNNNKHGQIRFWGNVQVGRDVSLTDLRKSYHAVVLATGCETDRRLQLPILHKNDDNNNNNDTDTVQLDNHVLSAREFVHWYNGHPDFVHVGKTVAAALRNNPAAAHVCVIGQGNVALDCARIIAKGTPGLVDTDICSHALEVLQQGVAHVSIVGRRGHVQGAFTIKEVRELVKLQAEDMIRHLLYERMNWIWALPKHLYRNCRVQEDALASAWTSCYAMLRRHPPPRLKRARKFICGFY